MEAKAEVDERLNSDLDRARQAPAASAKRRREAYVRNYCGDVGTVLKVLNGLANRDAAKAALNWPIALVGAKTDRAMVAAEFMRASRSTP
jgi:hypothetical protein